MGTLKAMKKALVSIASQSLRRPVRRDVMLSSIAASRSFQTSAPRQGVASTIGVLGIAGTLIGPGVPGIDQKYAEILAKDEHKVLVWLGSMAVFGTMASMGGGGEKSEAPAEESSPELEAFLKSLEEEETPAAAAKASPAPAAAACCSPAAPTTSRQGPAPGVRVVTQDCL